MANSISIEIGSHSVRAAVWNGAKTELVPLGYSSAPYFCPSVAVCLDGDRFLFGDYAKNYIYTNPENFHHISDVDSQSQLAPVLYGALFRFIFDKAKCLTKGGLSECIIVVPSYYGKIDPRKTVLTDAARSVEMSEIRFMSDAEALCSGKVQIDNGSVILVVDWGYSGLTISSVYREEHNLKVKYSKHNDFGGRYLDSLILSDVENSIPSIQLDGALSQLLIAGALGESAGHIKEELSHNETCQQSVIIGNYEISRSHFVNLAAKSFADALKLCKEVLDNSGLSFADIGQIVLCGGCSNIPYVMDLFSQYFVGNGNAKVKICRYSDRPGYQFDACLGAFVSNSSSLLKLSF